MEKQIYGNITNTARTQFQFDKIYANKREMDEFCDSDGIYAGRYVLIEYDENPARNATKLVIRNGKFYYADFPAVQVIPNVTIAPGKLCYVIDENGSYVFYEPQDSKERPFKQVYICPSINNNYNTNWNIDYEKDGRGYDSTVWQKIYKNNKQEYIMIAELNTVVPNFTITADAPNDNKAPHFDKHSSDLNYNLHMPSQWDFRIKEAAENEYSDEITEHLIKYDQNGNPLEQIKAKQVPAAIFYNKQAFSPVEYEKISIVASEDEEKYASGKYYYIIKNVYGLCEDEYSERLDTVKFYKEIEETAPKKIYYNEGEELKLEEVDLLKTNEINWENGKYYYISKYDFKISTGEFDENLQYYEQEKNNAVIHKPINLTKDTYKPNTYYILTEVYALDGAEKDENDNYLYDENNNIIINEENSFNENIVYYKKENNNYVFIHLVNKPIYEANKYYAFCQNYYIIDYSEERDLEKIYYEKKAPGVFEEVKFLKKAYIKNVYFYINEDGNYVIDTSEDYTEGRQYYHRVIPVVVEGIDKISITPTGSSGRKYNNHDGILAAQNDIQEISINFPSIGRIMSEIWNLIYGKQRNELIYGTPIYNPNMYGENHEPLYQTGINDLTNFITIVNQTNDLIGHNIIKISKKNSIFINENKEVYNDQVLLNYLNIDNLESHIYWLEKENKFYRLKLFKTIEDKYFYNLISLSSLNKDIDSIYEALLQIHKALGTNENVENASPDSLKGMLIKLRQIIKEQSEGVDFLTIGESLIHDKRLAWKDIYNTPLDQIYNKNIFIQADFYKDKYYQNEIKYDHYFEHEFFAPFKKENVEDISSFDRTKLYGKKRFKFINIQNEEEFESNKVNLYVYNNNLFAQLDTSAVFNEGIDYFVINNNENNIYELFDFYYINREGKKIVCFDSEKDENDQYLADYCTFTEMSLNEIESPLTNYYVIVLPQYEYATIDENGKDIKTISNSNIFNEIIEYNKYAIMHDVPKPSKKDENNIIFNLKQNNNFSALAEVQVNKTGHVYSDGKKLFNLPQAIIVSSEEELNNLDVPVGTLAYVANHIFDKLDTPVIELITENINKLNTPVIELITENANKLDRTTIELISEIIKTKELDVPTIELLRTIINK